ncbi:MAG: peptidoglycan bridge formation glycyltransferase FemA/FemB family protein [Acholeplasma sp.]|nr:peptidoglycan bridge formation glycyltransferase FemA/FemB family protein [Acholeplasma sp.]CCY28228.1 femAB family protein [Acholeplasma sp. CAG:878]
MYIKQLTNSEFSEFTKTYPLKSIYQTKAYALVMNQQGFDSLFLGMFDNEKIVAASLILVRKENGFKYAYAPRGFLINYNDLELLNNFTNEIKKYLGSKGIIAVKLNPLIVKNILDFNNQNMIANKDYNKIYGYLKQLGYYHFGYNNFFEALKPRFDAVLRIDKQANVLFKNVRKGFKTKIRNAINCGIKIYKGNIDTIEYLYEQAKHKYPRDLNYFKDCYNYFSKDNLIDYYYTKLDTAVYLKHTQEQFIKYEQESQKLNNRIMNKPGKNNKKQINKKINIDKYLEKYRKQLIEATEMLKEYPNGIVTSTILIVREQNEITILLDAHEPKYQRFNSKHLLIWQLIQKYSKDGYKIFNMGGISNALVDTKYFTGLNEFKLSFGSVAYEYLGDLELITNKRGYNMYRSCVPIKNLIKSKLIRQ